jgi:hypothetical protein
MKTTKWFSFLLICITFQLHEESPTFGDECDGDFIVHAPGSTVLGKTIGEWGVAWWKWANETPADANPNQRGWPDCSSQPDSPESPVIFLPSVALRGENVVREWRACTVPCGKPVLVPTLLVAAWGCNDCETCRQTVGTWLAESFVIHEMDVEVDGESLANPEAHRETSIGCFSFFLPPENLRGETAGWRHNAALEGFLYMVDNLCPGEHTIRTSGLVSRQGVTVDIECVYELTVLPSDPPGPRFLRADCNDDGVVDISDAVFTLGWLFLGEPEPGCVAVANTNGDDSADISDAVYLLTHLFLGGPAPAVPFAECGPGELDADVTLGCTTPPEHCP